MSCAHHGKAGRISCAFPKKKQRVVFWKKIKIVISWDLLRSQAGFIFIWMHSYMILTNIYTRNADFHRQSHHKSRSHKYIHINTHLCMTFINIYTWCMQIFTNGDITRPAAWGSGLFFRCSYVYSHTCVCSKCAIYLYVFMYVLLMRLCMHVAMLCIYICTRRRWRVYVREVGGWGRVPFSRNLMSPTPRRKWYLTTGRRFH